MKTILKALYHNATLSGLGGWQSSCWKLAALMGESQETSLKGQMAREQSNNQNLADPASVKVQQKENTTLMLKSYPENKENRIKL